METYIIREFSSEFAKVVTDECIKCIDDDNIRYIERFVNEDNEDSIYCKIDGSVRDNKDVEMEISEGGDFKISAPSQDGQIGFTIFGHDNTYLYNRMDRRVGIDIKFLAEYIDRQFEKGNVELLDKDETDDGEIVYKVTTEIQFSERESKFVIARYALDIGIHPNGEFDIHMWDRDYESDLDFLSCFSKHIANRMSWYDYCKTKF